MHHQSRRLTPHPAGLPSVIATLFVVLAAFLSAADPSTPAPPRAAAPRRLRPAGVTPPVTPAPSGAQTPSGLAPLAVTDSIGGDDDGCAEHGETRRIGGRTEKRASSSTTAAQAVIPAPRALSCARRAVAPTPGKGVAPSPCIPRAPPAR